MRRLIVLIALCAAAGSAAQASASPTVHLLSDHRVFDEPRFRSHEQPRLTARRPLTGARTILPVLATREDTAGRQWLRVAVPGRPNGHSGWIGTHATSMARTQWRVMVQLRRRRVSVLRRGRVVRVFKAIVGAPETPTPTGRFFVEESVALERGDAGAPIALALSARSNVLHQFAGGPGQIAIHGRGGVGGELGTAVSHGCIRLDRSSISWLAQHIGAGTRVSVVHRRHR